MENLDTGKDKIKKICEILKQETLTPAKEEAQKVVAEAEQEAREIIRVAETKAQQLVEAAKNKISKERELFEYSLQQACRQGMETLRQDIEKRLFNTAFSDWIGKQGADPTLASQLIEALVKAVEKEGLSANFSAAVPKSVAPEKVNALLGKEILERLREKSVVVADFLGGVQLSLHDKCLTLDLSDQALKELIGQYVRKDFRELLFTA